MVRSPIQWMLMPLRRYAQLQGRAARAEYWWFVVFGTGVSLLATGIDTALGSGEFGRAGWLLALALLPPQLAVSVRRLHDIGRTGWWAPLPPVLIAAAVGAAAAAMTYGMPTSALSAAAFFLGIAGLVAAIAVLVWHCTPGTAGANRFGPDPYDDDPLGP